MIRDCVHQILGGDVIRKLSKVRQAVNVLKDSLDKWTSSS